ncbi:MAG: type II toxin-antitoxin system HicA family toxin [Dongiaceae bacterium]
MRANPRADWRIDELETVARAVGANARRPSGSHVIFEHAKVAEALSVPAHRPIKPIYVTKFVAWIEPIERSGEEGTASQED